MEPLNLEIGQHIRQGDVMLMKTDDLPVADKLREEKSKIMVEGEATGHHHKMQSAQVLMLKKPEGLLVGFAKLEEPDQIVHQTHGQISLGTGIYKIIRQREFFRDQALSMRFVQD